MFANNEELAAMLSRGLRLSTSTINPPAGLADRVIERRRKARRHSQLAGAGTAMAGLVVAAVTLGAGAPSSPLHAGARLRLSSYTFTLPDGSRSVPATPAACAIGAAVGYTSMPDQAPSSPQQPSIAQAVTATGGCVSMLLTSPYTPGSANAPQEPFTVVDQHTIQLGSYTATVGTYEVIGKDMTFNGVPVPSGTQHLVITVQLPASDGQDQDLQVAAAGISEQELASIVATGLPPAATSSGT